MTLSLPHRSSRSRLDPLPRGRWVTALCAAAGLHLLALGALLFVRPSALDDAETPPDLVVSLVTEPATVDMSASPIPPVETSTMQAEPEPIPPQLPEPQQPPVTETAPSPPEAANPSIDTEPAARPLPPPEVQPPRPAAPALPPRLPQPRTQKLPPAQPRVAAPPKNTAPVPGETRGPSSVDFIGRYRNTLADFIRPYQRYPALARTRHQEGVVVLQVTIKRNGEVTALSVQHGSGFDALDREALAALKRAAPLPPIPEGLPGATLDLEFSLHFHLE